MKFRLLAILPLLLVVPFATASLMLGDRMPIAVMTASEAGKVLSLAGAVIAALAFERGDYLRRAWLRYGACYVFLLVNDFLSVATAEGHGQFVARGLVVTVGNAFAVWGTWMLARAWSVAGLDEEGHERRRKRRMFRRCRVAVLGGHGVAARGGRSLAARWRPERPGRHRVRPW